MTAGQPLGGHVAGGAAQHHSVQFLARQARRGHHDVGAADGIEAAEQDRRGLLTGGIERRIELGAVASDVDHACAQAVAAPVAQWHERAGRRAVAGNHRHTGQGVGRSLADLVLGVDQTAGLRSDGAPSVPAQLLLAEVQVTGVVGDGHLRHPALRGVERDRVAAGHVELAVADHHRSPVGRPLGLDVEAVAAHDVVGVEQQVVGVGVELVDDEVALLEGGLVERLRAGDAGDGDAAGAHRGGGFGGRRRPRPAGVAQLHRAAEADRLESGGLDVECLGRVAGGVAEAEEPVGGQIAVDAGREHEPVGVGDAAGPR